MEKQGNKTSYEASGMTMERGKNQSNLARANFLRAFLRLSIYMQKDLFDLGKYRNGIKRKFCTCRRQSSMKFYHWTIVSFISNINTRRPLCIERITNYLSIDRFDTTICRKFRVDDKHALCIFNN